MRVITVLRLRLRSLLRRDRVDQELDEELRYHLERDIEESVLAGMDPDEARRVVRRTAAGLVAAKRGMPRHAGGERVRQPDAGRPIRRPPTSQSARLHPRRNHHAGARHCAQASRSLRSSTPR